MILQFQTKLGIKTKSDWELFNYIMTLHHILAYMASRDQLFSNSSVSYMSQLLLKTDTKYLNSVYNITLGLLHTGERELAFKCILTMLEHLQISTSESNSTHLAIFELSAKYAIETNNYYTHIKKSITGYISKQIITRSVHDTRSTNLHKIIDIYCRVHMAYIDVCLLNSHPVAQLVNKEDLLGERLSPTCHAFKGEILDRELVNYYKKSLENIQTNNEKLSGYLAEIIQLIVQMLVTEVYAVNSSQYAAVVLKYIEIVSVCEKGFVGE